MKFACSLVPGTLIRRYKRFLADVELANGMVVTAHCANPGAMLGLNMPGLKVWLEPNDDPRRKLKFTWRLVEVEGVVIGIDTSMPNKIIGHAIRGGIIPELKGYSTIQPEQRYSKNSRVDFLLQDDGKPDCFVEVKNCHLLRTPGLAEFPDSVTERGARHLHDLGNEVERGNRAVMVFCIQRSDCEQFTLAGDIDPAYLKAYRRALARGVEVLAYRCTLDTTRIRLERAVSIVDASARIEL
ncbi:MAG: DNA/RNA nuclease SfsA [Paracoccaceae bacterium]